MRSLGRAKKRLKLRSSIRISKLLYDWLNTGKQKRTMRGEDSTCPCCGQLEENWLHLFQCNCNDGKMSEAFRNAIRSAKTEMVKAGISSKIFNAYVAALCEAAGRDHPGASYQPEPQMEETLQAQKSLGSSVILRGFQHKAWLEELQGAWIAPAPNADGTTAYKKDVVEQATVLIRTTWDIFETIWDTRNKILHGEECQITQQLENQKIARLLEFKRNKFDLLRRCDHFIVGFQEGDVSKWASSRRRRTVEVLLERLHRIHLTELRLEADGLQRITNYFQPATTAPSTAPAPRRVAGPRTGGGTQLITAFFQPAAAATSAASAPDGAGRRVKQQNCVGA